MTSSPTVPAVTIVLPFLNAAATLQVAIRSILLQTFSDWELLLINDGSSDGSLDIAKSINDPRVRVLSDGLRCGISVRLNQGVAAGRGRYFCRMDADDIAFPERLSRQFAYLEGHPEVDLVGASVLVFDDSGDAHGCILVEEFHDNICAHPWRGFYLPHPTWMGRRVWFLEHPYDPEADGSEDQQLLYRGFRSSRYAGISDVLLGYRENPRVLGKMFKRRVVFWKSLSSAAIRAGAFHHAFMISLSQLIKMVADVLNLKLSFHKARNRLHAPDKALRSQWSAVIQSVTDGSDEE